MRRISGVLLTVILLGAANADTVKFNIDDSAFSYGEADVSEGFIDLNYEDGELSIVLSDEALESELPSIEIEASDDSETLSDIGMIESTTDGRAYSSLGLSHADASLDEVAASYLSDLETMGFEAEVQETGSATQVYILSNGDYEMRAVFTRQGGTVTAYLAGA